MKASVNDLGLTLAEGESVPANPGAVVGIDILSRMLGVFGPVREAKVEATMRK